MRDEVKLKLCPFCGSKARLVMERRAGGRSVYFVECVFRTCGVPGPRREMPYRADRAWNSRYLEEGVA